MNLSKHLTIFFADNGLSQTEANHQANMVKEIASTIARSFTGTAAVTETIEITDSKGTRKLHLDSKKTVDNLQEVAVMEGELFALSAWLREAIKAKSSILDMINAAEEKSFMEDGEVYPEVTKQRPYLKEPAGIKTWTVDDVVGEFTIAERAEYLTLEAIAAHLGKKLHNNGILTQIREELQNFIPYRFHDMHFNGGKHSFPVERLKLYSEQEFEKDFFALQEKHRSVESKLNWYKARINNTITERNAEAYNEYREKYNAAYAAYEKELNEFNTYAEGIVSKQVSFSKVLNERRLKMIRSVSAWKIIVPESLQSTLDYVKDFKK